MLKKLCEAVGEDRPMTTIYGGLVGIGFFGSKAVDSFILPVAIRYWNEWSQTLDATKDLSARAEIQECQHALLVRSGLILIKHVLHYTRFTHNRLLRSTP